jgi:hypothetical protein
MGLLAGLSAASPRGARPINCIAWPIFWRRYGATITEQKQRVGLVTEVYDESRRYETKEREE